MIAKNKTTPTPPGKNLVLVSMPFAGLDRPPIGISVLASLLRQHNQPVCTLSLNLTLARLIGRELYDALIGASKNRSRSIAYDAFFGEFAFSNMADNHRYSRAKHYLDWLSSEGLVGDLAWARSTLAELQQKIPTFLEEGANRIAAANPDIVGFSCTFQQTWPSIILARHLRRIRPDVTFIFGGPAFASEMGRRLFYDFEVVDAACLAEAEETLEALLRVLRTHSHEAVGGCIYRSHKGQVVDGGNGSLVRNLEPFPPPDYDDHFSELPREIRQFTRLQYEGSRGCWWGQKHHCTFCGQNAEGLAYREKSAHKVEAEINALCSRYGIRSIEFCDNILSPRLQRQLLPRLAQRWPPPRLFFEVKSNLRRGDIRLFAAAGVTEIQPGIEALVDTQLKRMRKGVTGLQNIALLKWCRVFRVTPYWNLLWGFPGETLDDYRYTRELIPLLSHFTPPQACSRLRVDRFSPFFMNAKDLGIKSLKPYSAYRHLFADWDDDRIRQVAYHFEVVELEYGFSTGDDKSIRRVDEQCSLWRDKWSNNAVLRAIEDHRGWVIEDRRPLTQNRDVILTNDAVRLLASCERPNSISFNNKPVEALCKAGLMVADGARAVSLVEFSDEQLLKLGNSSEAGREGCRTM